MCTNSWTVYIIETEQSTLYTGITTDVERRFQEHLDMFNGKRSAKGAKYFRRAKPLKIVYAETCANRSEATKREAAIKRMTKAKKVALIADHPASPIPSLYP